MVVVSFNLEDISNKDLNQNIIKIPNSAIIERFMTP
jgi:small-conductance mechanosensitive channel